MSISTIKIDFTKLNESETKEVLSYIQEYENTCEAEIKSVENTAIAHNVLQSVSIGAMGVLTFSVVDKLLKNENVSALGKTIFMAAGALEIGLCTAVICDNIIKTAKIFEERKKRKARTNILNADIKAELSINKILLKNQEEDTKNKKK